MKKIKAVFFDVDGTLVSFDTHKIPESTFDALRKLKENGTKIFVATGRMLPMLTMLDGVPFDGYVAYNGAQCVNAQKEEIFSNPLPQRDLEALAAWLEHDLFPVAFLGKNEMTVNIVDEKVIQLAEHINTAIPRVQHISETIRETVYQVCIYVDEERETQLMRDVFSGCEASRWTSLFADVNIRGNSKRTGVEHLLNYYGIDASEAMAFGDGGNDIPMLQHVAVGVAMGNANEQVKRIARYVTRTVDDNGIAHALKEYGML